MDGSLALEVLSKGSAGAPGAHGHGLVGMRERVELYGGSLAAGPEAGGFAVRAAGLRMILDAQADLEVVGEAGDGRDALLQ